MNRRIGVTSSAIHLCSALGFVLCLIIGSSFGNYLSGMALALSFIPLICSFSSYSKVENKTASFIAIAFACIYVTLILLVYYANVTTVRLDSLTQQAYQMISTQEFGLFFNYDLLGYGIMSLSAFFIGLTIESSTKEGVWLRRLLLSHGVFFISSFLIPLLGLFSVDSPQSSNIGQIIQSVWCIYFSAIDILSLAYFSKQR